MESRGRDDDPKNTGCVQTEDEHSGETQGGQTVLGGGPGEGGRQGASGKTGLSRGCGSLDQPRHRFKSPPPRTPPTSFESSCVHAHSCGSHAGHSKPCPQSVGGPDPEREQTSQVHAFYSHQVTSTFCRPGRSGRISPAYAYERTLTGRFPMGPLCLRTGSRLQSTGQAVDVKT